ncbi:hypothetical protein H2198_003529 [Neophaeococcomyces mojaviensis]|uniref:Uncharacterized protein n=1 Tax=Neophaeococcomyces mojaviensis TaxID=3383035 RepID=A0ACC3AAY0_9EURO|nr:hypothetical protein H2198_003529 [Knufia sp. JES_112]
MDHVRLAHYKAQPRKGQLQMLDCSYLQPLNINIPEQRTIPSILLLGHNSTFERQALLQHFRQGVNMHTEKGNSDSITEKSEEMPNPLTRMDKSSAATTEVHTLPIDTSQQHAPDGYLSDGSLHTHSTSEADEKDGRPVIYLLQGADSTNKQCDRGIEQSDSAKISNSNLYEISGPATANLLSTKTSPLNPPTRGSNWTASLQGHKRVVTVSTARQSNMTGNLLDTETNLPSSLPDLPQLTNFDGASQSTEADAGPITSRYFPFCSNTSANSHNSASSNFVDLTGISDDTEDNQEGIAPLHISTLGQSHPCHPLALPQTYSAQDSDGSTYNSPYAPIASGVPTIMDYEPALAPPGIPKLPNNRPGKEGEYTSILECDLAATKHKLAQANHQIHKMRMEAAAEVAKVKVEMETEVAKARRESQELEQKLRKRIAQLDKRLKTVVELDEGEENNESRSSTEEGVITIEDDTD